MKPSDKVLVVMLCLLSFIGGIICASLFDPGYVAAMMLLATGMTALAPYVEVTNEGPGGSASTAIRMIAILIALLVTSHLGDPVPLVLVITFLVGGKVLSLIDTLVRSGHRWPDIG